MVFSSATFLFYFFPLFLLLYYLLPWKNGVLLVGSLLFYAWGEPRFVPLLLASALLNYGVGWLINAARGERRRQAMLVLGVAANLAFLMYYKYIGFFAGIYNQLAQPLGHGVTVPAVVLPLGISFFTFQGISYLIDLYRRDIEVQSSFWRFAMYKAMFPQLIAGPIVRYRQIAHEIAHRDLPNARIWAGFRQFIVGLAQKMLIANTVALSADRLFGQDPSQLTTAGAWIGIACYTIQILFDFGGYSNMAIGIGHMLGFSYPPNFQRPYASLSMTEFWRRWHISLSSWFRDYLYIPLGGNRHGPLRTYLNLGLVFLLCGLWHGAAWTFVIWGLWHGALLVAERLGLGAALARLPSLVAQAYTLLMVMLGWVFFRADSVPHALSFLRTMAGLQAPVAVPHAWQMDFTASSATALAIGVLIATVRLSPDAPRHPAARLLQAAPLRMAGLAAAFLLCVLNMAAGTYNPFIYFRF
ncbi:MBOAT family protein [Rugamonas sp. FT82W]|uniref:Probable alginate O-acetylase AlgI n=1 Tax=Duganella vulcania TaxID=2692166 RepID=A0A845GDZ4_9BURK|nr:MBOAT family protein [Duganella vulcania]MYM91625.1 MBOAT family protein [Duganella vulcania]